MKYDRNMTSALYISVKPIDISYISLFPGDLSEIWYGALLITRTHINIDLCIQGTILFHKDINNSTKTKKYQRNNILELHQTQTPPRSEEFLRNVPSSFYPTAENHKKYIVKGINDFFRHVAFTYNKRGSYFVCHISPIP
jgi:hypothetical protein